MCNKPYPNPKIFCFPEKKRAIDYIYDWIDIAEEILKSQGERITLLEEWNAEHADDIISIPEMQADIAHLKTLEVEGGVIDLTKISSVFDEFDFDAENNIIRANIFPGILDTAIGPTNHLVVTEGDNKIMRSAIAFNGDSTTYLSGAGTFEAFPIDYLTISRERLITLRDNAELTPGAMYRMIGYTTVIFDEKAVAVEIPIDILIMATGESTLSEDVHFIQNATTPYFNGSKVSSWKGKYCIDNDVTRFDFVNAYKEFIILSDGKAYVRASSEDIEGYYAWKGLANTAYEVKAAIEPYIATGTSIPVETITYTDETIYTDVENPEIVIAGAPYKYNWWYDSSYGTPTASQLYSEPGVYLSEKHIQKIIPVSNGVIYHLVDDRKNEACYDFKSIQFVPNDDASVVGFTFSKFNEDSHDFSTDASLLQEENVNTNTIEARYESFMDSNSNSVYRLSLNSIIHNSPCVNNHYGPNCHDILIFGGSFDNTWMGESSNDVFSGNVQDNIFHSSFTDNTFIDYAVKSNVFGTNFYNNNFTVAKHTNVQRYNGITNPIFEVSDNTFGANFKNNIISLPMFKKNTFGDDVDINTFNATVMAWSEGGITYQDTLYTEDKRNFVNVTVGNKAEYNKFNGLSDSTIGKNFRNNLTEACTLCTYGDSVSIGSFKNNKNVILQGYNKGILLNYETDNTMIECWASYIKSGCASHNIHVHSEVQGTAENYQDLPLISNSVYKEYRSTMMTYQLNR